MDESTFGTSPDSVAVQIVNAVADETGRDPNALPPLYSVVNPDAVNTLIHCTSDWRSESGDVEITFEFADCTVTVSSTGGVAVSAGGEHNNETMTHTVND